MPSLMLPPRAAGVRPPSLQGSELCYQGEGDQRVDKREREVLEGLGKGGRVWIEGGGRNEDR